MLPQRILLGVILFFLTAWPCFSQETKQSSRISVSSKEQKYLNECEKAGGKLVKIKECDGSESDWCVISEKEQCYADQVNDGKCTVGEYSEELKGIVGITPRVICDGLNNQ